jgi:hypothetical protein
MIIKKCEFCGKDINTKIIAKRFCNDLCQRKHYYRMPEIREKYRKRMRIIRNTDEFREKNRTLASTRYRESRRQYKKIYGARPEVRARIREKERLRRLMDLNYTIAYRLRRSLNHALEKYSRTGKIMNSREYGINWKEIINSLRPFPQNTGNFEIDHIMPLHTFDLTNPGEVKDAFSPSNLQWLTREENRRKSGKIINKSELKNNMPLSLKAGVKNSA